MARASLVAALTATFAASLFVLMGPVAGTAQAQDKPSLPGPGEEV